MALIVDRVGNAVEPCAGRDAGRASCSPSMFTLSLARRIGAIRLPPRVRGYAAPPPSGLTDGERTIYTKLTEKFDPAELQVQDVSGGCGTFYQIIIASGAFKGMPTVKQHRMVNETLKQEIEGIHGLQLTTRIV